jgi:hypothetical protein
MATTYGNISVAATATLIVGANPDRKGVVITNESTTAKLYIGPDSSITTSNAVSIEASGKFTDAGQQDNFKGDIYGIVATSTNDVRYWEWTP